MGIGRAAPRQRPLAISLRGRGRDVEKLITLWSLVNHTLVFHRENAVNGARCVVWWVRPRLSPKVPDMYCWRSQWQAAHACSSHETPHESGFILAM